LRPFSSLQALRVFRSQGSIEITYTTVNVAKSAALSAFVSIVCASSFFES
jgi:hypothetical protein